MCACGGGPCHADSGDPARQATVSTKADGRAVGSLLPLRDSAVTFYRHFGRLLDSVYHDGRRVRAILT